MDKLAGIVGKKVGDAVEDAVKGALHLGNKDKDKNKKKGGGGIFSRTGGDKDKKKEVDKGEGKGGLFHREDEDEKERKSGFKGLFTEGPLPEAGGGGGAAMEGEDLLDDLFELAEETSRGN
ncbi:unnamed protein product [Oreochromis niloticus]|nr:unnamed protein product [Mustela putorius furo]